MSKRDPRRKKKPETICHECGHPKYAHSKNGGPGYTCHHSPGCRCTGLVARVRGTTSLLPVDARPGDFKVKA